MSDMETGIMPAPHVVYASGNSLGRYRPAFTSVNVNDGPAGGKRLEVNDDGRIIRFDLNPEQAKLLADLLLRSPNAE